MTFSFFPIKRVVARTYGVGDLGNSVAIVRLECGHQLMYHLYDPWLGNHTEEEIEQLTEQGCVLCRCVELAEEQRNDNLG